MGGGALRGQLPLELRDTGQESIRRCLGRRGGHRHFSVSNQGGSVEPSRREKSASMHSSPRGSAAPWLSVLDLDAVEEVLERALVDLDDSLALSLAWLGHAE